jgi:hypothetical protein
MKEYSYWAKRTDEAKHMIDYDSKGVGGSVLCGKYGALLGNNYAHYLDKVCPKCLEIAKERENK